MKKKLIDKKYSRFKLFIMPVVFFVIGASLVLYTALTYQTSLTVLAHNHFSGYSLNSTPRKLLKNNTISGDLVAYENNLGAVGIRIQNLNSKDVRIEDRLRFRIKEKGKKEWYYSGFHYGGQFHELEIFPFGFPAIQDSKGKTFTFEITSYAGEMGNALTLVNTKPVLVTQYQFSTREITQNIFAPFIFVAKKLLYCLTIPEFYIYILLFFLPFIVTVLALSPRGRKLVTPLIRSLNTLKKTFYSSEIGKQLIADVSSFTIIDYGMLLYFSIDTLLIKSSSIFLTTLFFLLWFIRVRYKKYDPIFYLLPGAIFVLICLLLSGIGAEGRAEKAAIWAIQFLFFGSLVILLGSLWSDFFRRPAKIKK